MTATDPNDDAADLLHDRQQSPFSVNPRTRASSPPSSPMDHEAQASYAATVTATDVHGATAQAEVTIAVNNLDEPGTVSLSNTAPRAGDTIAASLSDPDGAASNETLAVAEGRERHPRSNLRLLHGRPQKTWATRSA